MHVNKSGTCKNVWLGIQSPVGQGIICWEYCRITKHTLHLWFNQNHTVKFEMPLGSVLLVENHQIRGYYSGLWTRNAWMENPLVHHQRQSTTRENHQWGSGDKKKKRERFPRGGDRRSRYGSQQIMKWVLCVSHPHSNQERLTNWAP